MAKEEFGATFAGYIAMLECHQSYIITDMTYIILAMAELTQRILTVVRTAMVRKLRHIRYERWLATAGKVLPVSSVN